MSDQPESLVLVFLRRLDASMGELRADMTDLKHPMTAVEIQIGQQLAAEASHYASLAMRLDRIDDRLQRLERRTDLVPA